MTVDELWEEARSLVGKSTIPSERLREILTNLISTPEGLTRLVRGLEQSLQGKMSLLRHLGGVMDSSVESSSKLNLKERIGLLERATKAARGSWKEDSTYWIFLWLRIKNGQAWVANDALKDLMTLADEGNRR